MALAQLSISQLLLTVDLGSDIECEREAVRLAESTKDPVVVAGTLCLLYPSESTPPDLADTLARSLAAARSQDHVGLVMMALANLSMAALDQGQPAEAAVHARECAALAADLHHRGLVPTMLEIAELGELLSGDRSTRPLHRAVRGARCAPGGPPAAQRGPPPLRRRAALRRRPDEAARARGLYDALLIEAGAGATTSEVEFATRWLDGVPALAPREPVHEGALHLAREVEAAIPAPSANLQRSSPS